MRKQLLVSAGAAVLLAAGWVGLVRPLGARAEPTQAVSIGATAPNFTGVDQDGKKVSLSDYPGKIVVLEWTNPECPFVQRCYHDKTMVTLAEKFKDKGVAWIAIDSNDEVDKASNHKWAEENHIPYPLLDDAKGQIARAYAAKSTPDMFIIGKDGKLAYEGAIDNDPDGDKTSGKVNYVEKALDEMLAGKAVSTPETKSYGCGVHIAG